MKALSLLFPAGATKKAKCWSVKSVFVYSDKASFITGASYLVDGGKTAQ